MSWHYSDEYVGWAALPPSGPGYAFSVEVGAVSIGVGAWQFVPTRDFLNSNIDTHILIGSRNPELLEATRSAGSVRVVDNVVVNNLISITNVERVVKSTVVVHEVNSAEQPGPVTQSGQVVSVYRPAISRGKPKAVPKEADTADTLENKPAALRPDAKAQGEGKASKQPSGGSQDKPKDQPEPKQKGEPKDQPEPKQKAEPKDQPEPKQKGEPKDQPEPKQKAEPKDQPEPKQKGEPKDQPEPKQKAEPKDQPEPKQKAEPKDQPEPKQKTKPKDQPEAKQKTKPKDQPDATQKTKPGPSKSKQESEPKGKPEPN